MYYMHKTIEMLVILDIHKNLIPNCGMWDIKEESSRSKMCWDKRGIEFVGVGTNMNERTWRGLVVWLEVERVIVYGQRCVGASQSVSS